jgi:hypothetical protein
LSCSAAPAGQGLPPGVRDRLVTARHWLSGRWSRPGTQAGALALAVGLAVDDELVAGGGEPVDCGLGEQLVVHEAEPFIWGWHMFILEDPGWCLGYLLSGVSAGL